MIVPIDKQPYFDQCKSIVKDVLPEGIDLNDNEIEILTHEIMDTSLSIGGDYSEDTIRYITQEYMNKGFLLRFKRAHGYYE